MSSLEIIYQTRKDPKILMGEEYIDTQLKRPSLFTLVQQMGPNCNLSCPHCYGCFGKDISGLPNPEIIRKTLEEAAELKIESVCLSDGEPMREENREVMGLFAEYSSRVPVSIMTNAFFADSKTSAEAWFNFLKEGGFDLERNLFKVSTGPTYFVNSDNYRFFNEGIKTVFPKVDFGKGLKYSFLGFGDLDKEQDLFSKVLKNISDTFNVSKEKIKSDSSQIPLFFVPSGKSMIELRYEPCEPEGRAEAFEYGPERRKRIFSVEEMLFSVRDWEFLTIDYLGNVGFGDSQRCIGEGRNYGNVSKDSLIYLMRKIFHDPYYQANKLGGVRFIYHLAQEIEPDFKEEGRIHCNVCKKISSRKDLVEKIRERLNKNGIKEEYLNYLERRGLPIVY